MTTPTIKLMYISQPQPARLVSELIIGDVTIWNGGATAVITHVVKETAAFITFGMTCNESGLVHERRLKKSRLVGCEVRQVKAPTKSDIEIVMASLLCSKTSFAETQECAKRQGFELQGTGFNSAMRHLTELSKKAFKAKELAEHAAECEATSKKSVGEYFSAIKEDLKVKPTDAVKPVKKTLTDNSEELSCLRMVYNHLYNRADTLKQVKFISKHSANFTITSDTFKSARQEVLEAIQQAEKHAELYANQEAETEKMLDKLFIDLRLKDLRLEIEAINNRIEKSGLSIADIKEAGKAEAVIFNKILSGDLKGDEAKEVLNNIGDASKLSSDLITLDNYKETLKTQLMRIKSRFVICSRLNSPAGFSPSDLVFVKTSTVIQSDENPGRLPMCNEPLKLFDMANIQGSIYHV